MQEIKKKFPSLPSNYVTLQQLQERRLKEQREKEENEERKLQEQRLNEKQEMQKKEERQHHNSLKSQEIKAKPSSWPYRGNRRPLSQRNYLRKEEIGSEMRKEAGDVVVIVEEEISNRKQKFQDSKKTKKHKKRNKMKPKADDLLAGVEEQSQPENGYKEKTQVDTAEKTEGGKKIRSGFRRRSKVPAENTNASGGKDSVDRMVETARKLKDLEVADHGERVEMKVAQIENNERSIVEMNGDRSTFRSSGRFGKGRKPIESGSLMWVKKGEISDGIPAVFRRSNGRRPKNRK